MVRKIAKGLIKLVGRVTCLGFLTSVSVATAEALEYVPPPPLSYEESNRFFKKFVSQYKLRRPHYAWGALQGVNLAKVLGISRVSFIEFGVAGGNGLTALESIAERLEGFLGVEVDIHGFDAVGGMPKTTDPRDLPNLWREGFYPMDRNKLEQRLQRAKLHLGPVEETVPQFVASKPAPVAFVAFDLCFYNSTIKAFQLFDAHQSVLLPRVHCFFRNILGRTFGDHNGERLAMAEFNAAHETRKISKIYGLQYYLGSQLERWVDQFYMAHIFDHDLYGQYDGLIREETLDLHDERA
jgi:hypothetical protein